MVHIPLYKIMLENIEFKKIKEDEKETVINLLQLYSYDLSEILDMDVSSYGLYPGYKYLDEYFTEEDRNLFIILVGGSIAGFIMMNKYTFMLPIGTNSIAEFFILKKYRKKGLGTHAADYIFNNFPGRLEIRVLKENTIAKAFWDKIISNPKVKQHKQIEMDKDGRIWIVHDITI